jgi:aldose 1-epimerase
MAIAGARIASRAFGDCKHGAATLYTLRNKAGLTASVTDYGATLQSLCLPDKSGAIEDCILGFDDVSGYAAEGTPYFGSIVGRVANRIAKGAFSLGGNDYTLACNNGPNTLHGGPDGISTRLWKVQPIDVEGLPAALQLSLRDPDGHEGYPGDLDLTVTYTLTDSNELRIDMEARHATGEGLSALPTPINLASHTYWNLGGHTSGTVLDTTLQLNCPQYTPIDETSIPTGALTDVAGGCFDFVTAPQKIGARIGEVTASDGHEGAGGGYDHNMVVASDGFGKLSHVATCAHEGSGRKMELFASTPGVQFYTSNFLGPANGPFKGGAAYDKHHGFCLETQHYPDTINQPGFPASTLHAGEIYSHSMVHKFSAA